MVKEWGKKLDQSTHLKHFEAKSSVQRTFLPVELDATRVDHALTSYLAPKTSRFGVLVIYSGNFGVRTYLSIQIDKHQRLGKG